MTKIQSVAGSLGVLALVLASGMASASTPPAQIAVSPSRLELELGPRATTESLTVMNLGDRDVSIEVTVANWDLDENSRVRILEPDEQSLDQWMILNPLRFTIPAHGSQTVRFSIRPRVPPRPGEHRAMIYFNQVLPPAEQPTMRVRFSFGVAVYAMAGEISRLGELHDVAIVSGTNPVVLRLDVSSQCSAHVRLAGRYDIYPAEVYGGAAGPRAALPASRGDRAEGDGAVASGPLPSRPVLPSTRRQLLVQTERALPAGSYVLDLDGELTGERIRIALPFTIDDPALLAGAEEEAAR